jgi:hypothetical protein
VVTTPAGTPGHCGLTGGLGVPFSTVGARVAYREGVGQGGESGTHPGDAAPVMGDDGVSGSVRQRSWSASGGRRSASRSYTIKKRG